MDLFGRALLVGSRPLQLWPLLLCKAVLKVMAAYRTLDMTLPHQVRAAGDMLQKHRSARRCGVSSGPTSAAWPAAHHQLKQQL